MGTNAVDGKMKAIRVYCDAKAGGASNPDARKKADATGTKVNPNQLQLRWYGDPRNPNGVQPDPTFPKMTEAQQAAKIVLWRAEDGRSWGEIAILAHWLPESRVRTIFEKTSKVASTGHRTGQGGRFAFNDPALYAGNHKSLGTELSRAEVRAIRADEAKKKAYLEAAPEYKSQMKAKATAAKKALRSKGTQKVQA